MEYKAYIRPVGTCMVLADNEWYLEFRPQHEKVGDSYKRLGELPMVVHNAEVMRAIEECYEKHDYPKPYNPLRQRMFDEDRW